MYHLFDARNVQYDDFKSMIKDDKYSDKTKNILDKIISKDYEDTLIAYNIHARIRNRINLLNIFIEMDIQEITLFKKIAKIRIYR